MSLKLSLIRTEETFPCANLALEKFLTFCPREGEVILYLWQNKKTVVIGRNQNAWKECRVRQLKADGGTLVRRLSGGGAVFHDLGNLNFSFIARKEDYDISRQLDVILEAVRLLGIDAVKSGRNDLTAGERKFSGNAFYESGDYACHHGTLMVDVDKDLLGRYLNVSADKLKSKAVSSVRSRVVNLRELSEEATVGRLAGAMEETFGKVYGGKVQPFEKERLDAEQIRSDTSLFASWDWTFGRKIPFTHRMERRFDWGGAELELQVEGGIIRSAVCWSDAMDQEHILRIGSALEGCRYGESDMEKALRSNAGTEALQAKMSEDILNLIREELQK